MKRYLQPILASAAFACLALAPSANAQDDAKPLTKADVEAIVKQVIKDNPEFVMRTLMDYQQHDQAARISKAAQNLSTMKDDIQRNPRSPSVGNPKGDVTVVEFFDYHCGYCKRFLPEVSQLIREDKNVRVVFKEFPILSDDSGTAARAALAVYNIDKSKYLDYHILLMHSNNDFTPEVLSSAAEKIGISPDQFRKAFDDPQLSKDLDDNKQLAKDLAITGTPGIVIGTEFMPGAISYEKLKSTVQEVRDGQNLQKRGRINEEEEKREE